MFSPIVEYLEIYDTYTSPLEFCEFSLFFFEDLLKG